MHDSKSFKSLLSQSETIRDFQYCEKDDGTNNLWTISNGGYKLLKNVNGNDEFYNLNNDPYEQNNLITLWNIQHTANKFNKSIIMSG